MTEKLLTGTLSLNTTNQQLFWHLRMIIKFVTNFLIGWKWAHLGPKPQKVKFSVLVSLLLWLQKKEKSKITLFIGESIFLSLWNCFVILCFSSIAVWKIKGFIFRNRSEEFWSQRVFSVLRIILTIIQLYEEMLSCPEKCCTSIDLFSNLL